MTDTMVYKYGSYAHEVGEITDFRWEIVPNITERGYRDTLVARATLTGRFLGCGWEELTTKIGAMLDAYIVSDQKFALYNPDGSMSRCYLDPADPTLIVGPYVADLQFPTGTDEEYVTKRDFRIVLEGIALAPEDQLIRYAESIDHIGTCGPAWAYQYTLGQPQSYVTWPWTTQIILQQGSSTGLEGYYHPGWNILLDTLGIPVLDFTYEHFEQRKETIKKPKRMNRAFVYYDSEWRYTFESKFKLFQYPA